jgi:nicotinamide-nucleotide amidase
MLISNRSVLCKAPELFHESEIQKPYKLYMIADIINIGDELLIGQVINTNASWIAEKLNAVGIQVRQITSVSDNSNHIQTSVGEAFLHSSLIVLTGGLGPTKDDITKHTLAEYFNSKLILHEPTLKHVEEFFRMRGRPMLETNRRQAEIPECCEAIPNANGTAPGMWFEQNGKILVSVPGVPYEMKAIIEDHVLPRLAAGINGSVILHKTILTHGAGESFLAEIIEDWEDQLPQHIRLAYLPQPGMVRLRLTATGDNKPALEQALKNQIDALHSLIPDLIFGYDTETLESIIGQMLRNEKAGLCTAESCTGGYLTHLITRVPGSSDYFRGSVVAYSNELKSKLLNVEPSLIENYGAVSKEVVESMAHNARTVTGSDYAIATSGIAGPAGGSPEKPVGTVWVCVAGPMTIETKIFRFGNNRERNNHMSAVSALNMLRMMLKQSGTEKAPPAKP